MSPRALPSGGLVIQLVCRFHRYWAHSSKSTVRPKMESCSQDGACSVCFLRQSVSATPWTTSTPGFPVLHHLPELAQTHVLWVGDAIQPFCPLSSPSPPTFNLSLHQGLFQQVNSSHQVAKVLELQLQH